MREKPLLGDQAGPRETSKWIVSPTNSGSAATTVGFRDVDYNFCVDEIALPAFVYVCVCG